jgi:RHS repeat-associated protein
MVNKYKLFLLFFIIFVIISFMNFSTAQTDYNFTYDNNGNLIQGFGKYYEYNPFNQLERVRDTNSTGRILVEYSYGADGNRLLKKEFFIGGTNQSTYYINQNFVQIRNSSGIFNFTYYYDEYDLVAEKNPGEQIRYYHPDYLGSTTLITNGTGAIVEETFYLPYGDIIEGGNNSRYLFTGKERDNETQLYYYGSRYYSSFFSHFIQPDSVLPDVYDPQQLNRYSYARDNPYSYTDPSGNFINIAVGAAAGGFIAAVTDLYRQVVLGQQLTAGQVLKDVGIGVISGAVAGGTFGLAYPALGGGTLAGIGAGTTAGVASGEAGLIASSVLNNNIGMLTDPIVQAKTVAYGGVIGGVFGGIGGAINSISPNNIVGTGRINEPSPFSTKLSDGTIRNYGKFIPATNPGPTAGARGVKEILTDGTKKFIYESYDKYGRVTQIHPKSPVNLGHFMINPKTGGISGWRP